MIVVFSVLGMLFAASRQKKQGKKATNVIDKSSISLNSKIGISDLEELF